jgi:hypothetical protein
MQQMVGQLSITVISPLVSFDHFWVPAQSSLKVFVFGTRRNLLHQGQIPKPGLQTPVSVYVSSPSDVIFVVAQTGKIRPHVQ